MGSDRSDWYWCCHAAALTRMWVGGGNGVGWVNYPARICRGTKGRIQVWKHLVGERGDGGVLLFPSSSSFFTFDVLQQK